MPDSPHLHRDIARLTAALAAAVAAVGGSETEALCQRIGAAAQQLRAGALAGGRSAFAAAIAALPADGLEELARASALQCHLLNIAEERERLRALRRRGEHPGDGVAAAVDAHQSLPA